ncbi:MAG: hypothetical protein WC934_11635 [Acidithiobacillus sp.]|jgi:precorrin-6B methylase 2|uniref:hypothetical protein n=1 Tax=Acidithiobacillus sp. TaxID=1872118 RepID=UPI003560AE46
MKSLLSIGVPHVSVEAVRMLYKIVTKESVVFEYGAGASTIFFARNAKLIYSVENIKEWYDKVKEELEYFGLTNCKITHCEQEQILEGEEDKYKDYLSTTRIHKNCHFKKYASKIDRFPDNYFDIILVDGRSRVACFLHAMSKVKPGGYIVLDDSHRNKYSKAVEAVSTWKAVEFEGHAYTIHYPQKTTIWQKPL